MLYLSQIKKDSSRLTYKTESCQRRHQMKKLVLAVFAAAILFAGAAIAEESKAAKAAEPKAASAKETSKVKVFKGEILSIDKEKCEITVKGKKEEKTVKVEAKLLEVLKVGDKVSVSAKGKVEKIEKETKKSEKKAETK